MDFYGTKNLVIATSSLGFFDKRCLLLFLVKLIEDDTFISVPFLDEEIKKIKVNIRPVNATNR